MNNQKKSRASLWRVRFFYHTWRRWVKPLSPERRGEIQVQLREASRPDFGFFLLVVLSCIIATQGLLVNSAAVIIGAMLVAPLMSPIIGLGLASITGDTRTVRDATTALVRGALLAILISFLITILNRLLPFVSLNELPTEVMARTHPSPIDLGVALAGGTAAAFALAMPNISAALPGVAIATALMPPLCTVGIGLAMGRWDVAGGAFILFITNTIAIAFAASFVFYGLGFSGPLMSRSNRPPRSLLLSALITFILLGSLSYVSFRLFQDASSNRKIEIVLENEVNLLKDVDLVEWDVARQGETIKLDVVIRTLHMLDYEDVLELQQKIADQLQQPVALVINQVFAAEMDLLVPPTPSPTPSLTLTYTPGPSPTSTSTPTPSPTLTPIPSSTATFKPTETHTATPTETPTPSHAKVVKTGLPRLHLLQFPNGPEIGQMRSNQMIIVLYGRQTVDGLVWVEVRDDEGRIGWMPEINLLMITLTPTITPSPSPTAENTPTLEDLLSPIGSPSIP